MVITSITDTFMFMAKLRIYGFEIKDVLSLIAHLPGCFCPWTFF